MTAYAFTLGLLFGIACGAVFGLAYADRILAARLRRRRRAQRPHPTTLDAVFAPSSFNRMGTKR